MNLNRNVLLVVSLLLPELLFAASAPSKNRYFVYVGTYTEGAGTTSKGIYLFRYNADSGQITPVGLAAETTNPTWMTLQANGHFLYAVNEAAKPEGADSGSVRAFSIDAATGKLTLLNEVASRGAGPCYLSVDRSGKYLLVANYTGGNVAVLPILPDGRLGEATGLAQHSGHGTNPARQEGPHPHSIDTSPDNRFAFVDDLGLDQLFVYKFDSAKGTLTPNDPPFVKFDPNTGPRHLAWRPDGRFTYVIGEMGSKVMVFSNDPRPDSLHKVQTISTLPQGFTERNDDAEIEVHPSGKFLYASNRGHDSIAVYTIDPMRGTLSLVEIVHTQGKEPRNFATDPTGKLLLVANKNSNNVVMFKIDQRTGRLTPTGQVLEVDSPVCVVFLRRE